MACSVKSSLCDRCGYPQIDQGGSTTLPCPECGMLPDTARVWLQKKRIRSVRVFYYGRVTISFGIVAATSGFHAGRIHDQLFLAVLMLLGYAPVFVYEHSTQNDLFITSTKRCAWCIGASLGVLCSFWVWPRVAFLPMIGPLLIPLVTATLGLAASVIAGVVMRMNCRTKIK